MEENPLRALVATRNEGWQISGIDLGNIFGSHWGLESRPELLGEGSFGVDPLSRSGPFLRQLGWPLQAGLPRITSDFVVLTLVEILDGRTMKCYLAQF